MNETTGTSEQKDAKDTQNEEKSKEETEEEGTKYDGGEIPKE